jgi:hypothetical protein
LFFIVALTSPAALKLLIDLLWQSFRTDILWRDTTGAGEPTGRQPLAPDHKPRACDMSQIQLAHSYVPASFRASKHSASSSLHQPCAVVSINLQHSCHMQAQFAYQAQNHLHLLVIASVRYIIPAVSLSTSCSQTFS